MPTINFLKQRRLTLSKFEKKDKQLFKYVLIAFSINLVIFIGLLSFNIWTKSKLTSVEKEQKRIERQILNNEEVEAKFLIFTNKLKLISELFQKRSDKQKAISFFANLFDETVFIDGITYASDSKDSLLSLRLTSQDIFSLDRAFNKLESEEVETEFPFVNKSALKRTSDGTYGMQLTIGLGEAQKETPSAPKPTINK